MGFGFGAIQAGLFLFEAFKSRNFSRFVVAEVVPELVDAIRRNNGRYSVNVAGRNGIEQHTIDGVDIFNPAVPADREQLLAAVAESAEICTALPSVKFFGSGRTGDVTDILSAGLAMKTRDNSLPDAVVYAAENHNHAAEILQESVEKVCGRLPPKRVQFLNTVIGKMSGVVTDPAQIAEQSLAPLVPGSSRAFLVEEFNRILITRICVPGFNRGIRVFEEKKDLLPFEEAKLYGHNATHALIGYFLRLKKRQFMSDATSEPGLLDLARNAFVHESGAALCRKHAGVDPLFSAAGYRAYAEDLLERMMNPHLRDTVDRITRDPARKLGWDDRLVGTMRLCLSQGVEPMIFARGAAAALKAAQEVVSGTPESVLRDLWRDSSAPAADRNAIARRILSAE